MSVLNQIFLLIQQRLFMLLIFTEFTFPGYKLIQFFSYKFMIGIVW